MANKLYDIFKTYQAASDFFPEHMGIDIGFWGKLKLMIFHPIQYYTLGKAALRINYLTEVLKRNGYWVTEGEQTNDKQ